MGLPLACRLCDDSWAKPGPWPCQGYAWPTRVPLRPAPRSRAPADELQLPVDLVAEPLEHPYLPGEGHLSGLWWVKRSAMALLRASLLMSSASTIDGTLSFAECGCRINCHTTSGKRRGTAYHYYRW